jgi:hypothetical protein
MNRDLLEPFVDADQAAKFLFLTRRHVLELARAGRLPGHPIGSGARRMWRFRLTELAAAVSARDNPEFTCDEKAVSFSTGESRSCGELKRLHGTLSTGNSGRGPEKRAQRNRLSEVDAMLPSRAFEPSASNEPGTLAYEFTQGTMRVGSPRSQRRKSDG